MKKRQEMMVYKQTIETQKAILWALALEKEIAQYDLPERVQKDYTTVLRRLRDLEKRFFVKVDRKVPSKKKGKEKKIYRITLFGLFVCASMDKKYMDSNFEKIVTAHSDKLLSFAKWEYFKSKGLSNLVKSNFFEQLRIFWGARMVEAATFGGMPLQDYEGEKQRRNVDWDILGFYWMYTLPEESKRMVTHRYGEKRWLELMELFKAVGEERDLRKLRDEFMFWNIKNHGNKLKALNTWKTSLNSERLA